MAFFVQDALESRLNRTVVIDIELHDCNGQLLFGCNLAQLSATLEGSHTCEHSVATAIAVESPIPVLVPVTTAMPMSPPIAH